MCVSPFLSQQIDDTIAFPIIGMETLLHGRLGGFDVRFDPSNLSHDSNAVCVLQNEGAPRVAVW